MPGAAALSKSAQERIVDEILRKVGVSAVNHVGSNTTTPTRTKAGWCLREGLIHIAQVDNQQNNILSLMEKHGPPLFYHSVFASSTKAVTSTASSTAANENGPDELDPKDPNASVQNLKEPSNCFQSLCRIVAGQQLAGSAAQAIWIRLLETVSSSSSSISTTTSSSSTVLPDQNLLTPNIILTLAERGLEMNLQKPAGLSLAKAKTLVDLATHFEQHEQWKNEEFFLSRSEEEIREALLQVKGIGPWSCDMFLLFFLERPNVFPIGDFGVRKGIVNHFGLKTTTKQGLSPTKDKQRIMELVSPYQPYLSLFTYYMWKAAATNIELYDDDDKDKKKKAKSGTKPKTTKIKAEVADLDHEKVTTRRSKKREFVGDDKVEACDDNVEAFDGSSSPIEQETGRQTTGNDNSDRRESPRLRKKRNTGPIVTP